MLHKDKASNDFTEIWNLVVEANLTQSEIIMMGLKNKSIAFAIVDKITKNEFKDLDVGLSLYNLGDAHEEIAITIVNDKTILSIPTFNSAYIYCLALKYKSVCKLALKNPNVISLFSLEQLKNLQEKYITNSEVRQLFNENKSLQKKLTAYAQLKNYLDSWGFRHDKIDPVKFWELFAAAEVGHPILLDLALKNLSVARAVLDKITNNDNEFNNWSVELYKLAMAHEEVAIAIFNNEKLWTRVVASPNYINDLASKYKSVCRLIFGNQNLCNLLTGEMLYKLSVKHDKETARLIPDSITKKMENYVLLLNADKYGSLNLDDKGEMYFKIAEFFNARHWECGFANDYYYKAACEGHKSSLKSWMELNPRNNSLEYQLKVIDIYLSSKQLNLVEAKKWIKQTLKNLTLINRPLFLDHIKKRFSNIKNDDASFVLINCYLEALSDNQFISGDYSDIYRTLAESLSREDGDPTDIFECLQQIPEEKRTAQDWFLLGSHTLKIQFNESKEAKWAQNRDALLAEQPPLHKEEIEHVMSRDIILVENYVAALPYFLEAVAKDKDIEGFVLRMVTQFFSLRLSEDELIDIISKNPNIVKHFLFLMKSEVVKNKLSTKLIETMCERDDSVLENAALAEQLIPYLDAEALFRLGCLSVKQSPALITAVTLRYWQEAKSKGHKLAEGLLVKRQDINALPEQFKSIRQDFITLVSNKNFDEKSAKKIVATIESLQEVHKQHQRQQELMENLFKDCREVDKKIRENLQTLNDGRSDYRSYCDQYQQINWVLTEIKDRFSAYYNKDFSNPAIKRDDSQLKEIFQHIDVLKEISIKSPVASQMMNSLVAILNGNKIAMDLLLIKPDISDKEIAEVLQMPHNVAMMLLPVLLGLLRVYSSLKKDSPNPNPEFEKFQGEVVKVLSSLFQLQLSEDELIALLSKNKDIAVNLDLLLMVPEVKEKLTGKLLLAICRESTTLLAMFLFDKVIPCLKDPAICYQMGVLIYRDPNRREINFLFSEYWKAAAENGHKFAALAMQIPWEELFHISKDYKFFYQELNNWIVAADSDPEKFASMKAKINSIQALSKQLYTQKTSLEASVLALDFLGKNLFLNSYVYNIKREIKTYFQNDFSDSRVEQNSTALKQALNKLIHYLTVPLYNNPESGKEFLNRELLNIGNNTHYLMLILQQEQLRLITPRISEEDISKAVSSSTNMLSRYCAAIPYFLEAIAKGNLDATSRFTQLTEELFKLPLSDEEIITLICQDKIIFENFKLLLDVPEVRSRLSDGLVLKLCKRKNNILENHLVRSELLGIVKDPETFYQLGLLCFTQNYLSDGMSYCNKAASQDHVLAKLISETHKKIDALPVEYKTIRREFVNLISRGDVTQEDFKDILKRIEISQKIAQEHQQQQVELNNLLEDLLKFDNNLNDDKYGSMQILKNNKVKKSKEYYKCNERHLIVSDLLRDLEQMINTRAKAYYTRDFSNSTTRRNDDGLREEFIQVVKQRLTEPNSRLKKLEDWRTRLAFFLISALKKIFPRSQKLGKWIATTSAHFKVTNTHKREEAITNLIGRLHPQATNGRLS